MTIKRSQYEAGMLSHGGSRNMRNPQNHRANERRYSEIFGPIATNLKADYP